MIVGNWIGFLSFLLFFSLASGGGGGADQLWCVAKNNADDAALQAAIGWACGIGGADCGAIQSGGPCYDGSDLRRTASYAFNDYYAKNTTSDDNCNFGNSAALTSLNPSHGNCKFPSSSNSGIGNIGGAVTGYSADQSSDGSVGSHRDENGKLLLAIFALLLLNVRWN